MYSLLFTGNVKITVATVMACILVFLIIVVIVIVYMTPNIEISRHCIVFTFVYRECQDYSGDSDSLYTGIPDHNQVIVIVYMTPNIELSRHCIVFTFIYRECQDYSGDSDSLSSGVPDHCGYCYSLYDP